MGNRKRACGPFRADLPRSYTDPEFQGYPMRLVVLGSALFMAFGCTSALAQATPLREAPVGHRQPKANEVPQEQQQLSDPDKKLKELDEALAKKLKGICRSYRRILVTEGIRRQRLEVAI